MIESPQTMPPFKGGCRFGVLVIWLTLRYAFQHSCIKIGDAKHFIQYLGSEWFRPELVSMYLCFSIDRGLRQKDLIPPRAGLKDCFFFCKRRKTVFNLASHDFLAPVAS